MKITKTTIERLIPPEKGQALYWDDSLKGFGARITATGAIGYIAQARVQGQTRRVTLGRHGVLTSEEARKQAKIELGKMASNIDPSAEKQKAKIRSITLREVADDYKENRRTRAGLPLKQNTKDDIERHVTTTFSDWENHSIMGITREKVSKCYKNKSKTSVAQANQSMRVLSALIRYGAAKHRKPDGSRIIADNPVDVLRESQTLAAVNARTTAIPKGKYGEWWAEVQRRRNNPGLIKASRTAVDLIAFIALTGLRLTEAKTLKWSQVDLEDRSFKLIDTKNRRDVTFPLSDAAKAILAERHDEKEVYVFPGRSDGHLDNATKQFEMITKATGVEVTAHPLRRTFIQISLKELKLELWRIKALSNHKIRDDVTLDAYGDLTDVRFLKHEADKIADFYEAERAVFEADNVVNIEGRCRA
jgi:integrase